MDDEKPSTSLLNKSLCLLAETGGVVGYAVFPPIFKASGHLVRSKNKMAGHRYLTYKKMRPPETVP